jgi:hypothetical protein
VEDMAYLRREKEIVEMDFPLDAVWAAISSAITNLEWTIEETDELKHSVKAKSKPAFMSYSSILIINAVPINADTTRVNVTAETPTTTITGIIDFGRTRERIENFLDALMKQLGTKKDAPEKT